jgi:hypothetical protein
MESLNKREDTIFKCAEGLFRISQDLKSIESDISNTVLFLSDRLLKSIEDSTKELDPIIKHDEVQKEICPDCGGIKHDETHKEICPDCGGLKHDEDNICETPIQKEPYLVIVDEENKNDMSKQCNGHSAFGEEGFGEEASEPKQNTSKQIKNEVTSLIDEIRKGL